MRRAVLVLIAGCLVTGLAEPKILGQPVASPVVEAARDRQDRFGKIEVELKVRDVIAAGGLFGPAPGQPRGRIGPANETVVESNDRVVIDGKKFRYETTHSVWDSDRGVLLRPRLVNAFDGHLFKALYPSGLADPKEPVGFISDDWKHNYLRSDELAALAFTIRGANPFVSKYPTTALEPTGATLQVDGVTCQEHLASSSTQLRVRCWIDPAIDHLPRRLQLELNEKPVENCRVKYRRDERCGWVPESWVRTVLDRTGAVRRTSTVEVVRIVCGGTISQDLFELPFPPGTRVHDTQDGNMYRVRADGTAEVEAPKGKDSQPGESWLDRSRDLLVIGALAGVIGLGVVARVVWRKSARDEVTPDS